MVFQRAVAVAINKGERGIRSPYRWEAEELRMVAFDDKNVIIYLQIFVIV